MRIAIDLNVLLDVAQNRVPHYQTSEHPRRCTVAEKTTHGYSSIMSTDAIATKLAELERRLEALEATAFERKPKRAWRELIGSQVDDELFREAARLGAEWRAKSNAEGR